MYNKEKIEFGQWITPIEKYEVDVLSVSYSAANELFLPGKNREYLIENSQSQIPSHPDLIVRVLVRDTEQVYRIHFSNVGAFRVIDEHGLQEIIESIEPNNENINFNMFKVRNHGWSKESPLSFFMNAEDG